MSRKPRIEVIRACPHDDCSCNGNARVIDYFCDGCGGQVYPEGYGALADEGQRYAHQLTISLDPAECVSFFRRRDYCPACLEPVWQAISKLINADPNEERDRDYDDT